MNRMNKIGSIALMVMIMGSIYGLFNTRVQAQTSLIEFDSPSSSTGCDANFSQFDTVFFNGEADSSAWVLSHGFDCYGKAKSTTSTSTPLQGFLCLITGCFYNFTSRQGEYREVIDGERAKNQPYSLHKEIDYGEFAYYTSFSSIGLPTDGFYTTLDRAFPCGDSGTSTISVSTNTASQVEFQMNRVVQGVNLLNLFTAWNATVTMSIEYRAVLLDGSTIISDIAQNPRFENYTFTGTTLSGSNVNAPLKTAAFTGRTAAFTGTSDYINPTIVFYELIRVVLTSGTFSTNGGQALVGFDIYHDGISIANGWQTSDGYTPIKSGTCSNPENPEDLVSDFTSRSRWNFDYPVNIPNSSVNPDGYEGWTWAALGGGAANHTVSSSTCGGSFVCSATFTITRTTAVAENTFSTGFTPKSIQYKIFGSSLGEDAGGESSCGIGNTTVQSQQQTTAAVMSQRLFLINGEPLVFALHHHLFVSRANVGVASTCNFNVLLFYNVYDTDNILIKTGTISDKHYDNLAKGGSINDPTGAFQFRLFLPSTITTNFQFVKFEMGMYIYNFTQSEDCFPSGGIACTVSYNMFLDTYASNWMPFKDSNGNQCDLGEECTPQTPPSCWDNGVIDDCVPPPQPNYCDTHPLVAQCVGYLMPTGEPSDGGDGGGGAGSSIGVLQCVNNQISFSGIDLSSTDTGAQTSAEFVDALIGFFTCSPAFTGMLFVLLGGLVIPAAFLKQNSEKVILIFIAIWALIASAVIQVIPIWIGMIVMVLAGGFVVFLIRKPVGST